MVVGLLAEKPSAARNLAKALGGASGAFNGEKYVIVAARGHLYEFPDPAKMLVDPSQEKKYTNWDVENLPWNHQDLTWEWVAKDGTSSTIGTIANALKQCDEWCIFTDVDPSGEGDLLAWEVLSSLPFKPKSYSRAYFTDEAVSSLQKAFTDRKPLEGMWEHGAFRKAFFRSQADLLTMQFTRVSTRLANTGKMHRQGRLKSSMVALVGDGLEAVKAYKKVPFYSNRFRDENGVVYTNPDEPIFASKAEVPQTYSASAVVLDSKENKRTAPPKLIDLADLSAKLSSKGYKSKDVLATYQKMYEAEVVSYPRTEDKVITPAQFNDLLPLVDSIAAVVGVDKSLLTVRSPRKTHVAEKAAHGANRPGLKVPASLDALRKDYGSLGVEIYTTLARSYLSMLGEDYLYRQEKGHLADYPAFTGTVAVPLSQGYRAIFFDADDVEEETGSTGLGSQATPFVHEGFPPKPPTPTMKWLMKQLEKRNVGTGATRTSTFAEVTNEKTKFPLLKEVKGKLSFAAAGEESYWMLKGTRIGDLSTTEQFYDWMAQIEAGELTSDEVLPIIGEWVKEDIKTMGANAPIMREKLGVRQMQTKEKVSAIIDGQAVSYNREWGGYRFSDEEVAELNAGRTIVIDVPAKDGKGTFKVAGALGKGTFSKDGKTYSFFGFIKDVQATADARLEEKKQDPNRAFGVFEGKEITFKRTWSSHTFTDEEVTKLLAGETISFDFVTSKGKNMTVSGKLAHQTYNGNPFVGFEADFGDKKEKK